MSNSNSGISPFGWMIVFAVACAVLGQLFGSNAATTVTTAPATRDTSFERRYVEQRFKQEGYSSSDAATAADAVLKFHKAQEARKNR